MNKKLTAAERRVFLAQRSEELRTEAIALTGDPQARASQNPGHKGLVADQLPGGAHEAKGRATLERVERNHFQRAEGDPQKPGGELDRVAAAEHDKVTNVNVQEKALAYGAGRPLDPRFPVTPVAELPPGVEPQPVEQVPVMLDQLSTSRFFKGDQE